MFEICHIFLKESLDITKQQEGSVRCVRTLNSNSARPHFRHKYLPNKEQIENPHKFKFFLKKKCI